MSSDPGEMLMMLSEAISWILPFMLLLVSVAAGIMFLQRGRIAIGIMLALGGAMSVIFHILWLEYFSSHYSVILDDTLDYRACPVLSTLRGLSYLGSGIFAVGLLVMAMQVPSRKAERAALVKRM